MFTSQSSISIFSIVLCCMALYLLIIGFVYAKKVLAMLGKQVVTASPVQQFARHSNLTPQEQLLPPLIDKPADHPVEQAGYYPEEEPEFEMIDNQENVLLKEAEKVVEEIQDVVDHIASRPANPEEVFTKIRAIVSQYSFFLETEYYDAINSFVAVTVQRDCDLQLEKEDLKMLWLADAA